MSVRTMKGRRSRRRDGECNSKETTPVLKPCWAMSWRWGTHGLAVLEFELARVSTPITDVLALIEKECLHVGQAPRAAACRPVGKFQPDALHL